MRKNSVKNVPRYFVPYINDCFHNSYAAVLSYLNQNPNLILADYFSFMYDHKTGNIGVTYYYRNNESVEFTEEELNTSMELVYLPKTRIYHPEILQDRNFGGTEAVNINMLIHDEPDVAYARMKELIDSGMPVVAAVDLYYMPYHRAYQKEHGLHCIVITGYDEEENTLEVFDKYSLSSSNFDGTLPISAVREGRMSESSIGGSKRPIRNLWIEINIKQEGEIAFNKILRIFEESYQRMTGSKTVLGAQCGVEKIEEFRKDLLKKKESINDKTVAYFKNTLNISFKNVSRQRARFKVLIDEIAALLPNAFASVLSDCLAQSAVHWDICANIAYKFGITKSAALIEDLYTRLGKIKDLEAEITEKLKDLCLENKHLVFSA